MKLGPKAIPQANQLRMLEAMKAWLDPMRPHAQPQNEDNMYMLHIHAPMICISLNIYTVYTRTKYICVSKCTVLSVCILCIYIYYVRQQHHGDKTGLLLETTMETGARKQVLSQPDHDKMRSQP